MVSKAKSHDMSIVLAKLKRTNPVRELIKLHLEEVNSKFTIDISEFVFIAILLRQVLRELSKVLFVIRTVIVDALVNNQVFTVFNRT